MSFQIKTAYNGDAIKATAKFGKSKEICFTPFNGNLYCHLSDKKHCFDSPGGKFDVSKSKNVSFNVNEIKELIPLLQSTSTIYELCFKSKVRCFFFYFLVLYMSCIMRLFISISVI